MFADITSSRDGNDVEAIHDSGGARTDVASVGGPRAHPGPGFGRPADPRRPHVAAPPARWPDPRSGVWDRWMRQVAVTPRVRRRGRRLVRGGRRGSAPG